MAKSEETTSDTGAAKFAVPGADVWRAKMNEQVDRLAAAYVEYERFEKERAERSLAVFDSSAKLFKDSLAYAEKLGSEWRRLSLEATRDSLRSLG